MWNVETNSFFYRTALTKANRLKDQRVRVSWNNDLKSALNFWKNVSPQVTFQGIIATELLNEIPDLNQPKILKMLAVKNDYFVFSKKILGNFN